MFLDFFYLLRQYDVPVTLQEYLDLLQATEKGLANTNVDDFYSLCKITLIKNEQNIDRFDQIFGHYFKGVEKLELSDPMKNMFNDEWIKKNMNRVFSDEEKALIEKMGGLDKLQERLRELIEEQKERHEGGSKWVGTGGVSPFGNSGYNPEGIRIGGEGGEGTALKVWEKREYRDLSSDVELNTRNMKLALRQLRKLAREGAEEELDLDLTIRKTANNAGYLDINMMAAKKNHVKVLILFDVGGSMDPHVEICSELFSAAKAEFKHLEYFYFHNFMYEDLWKDNKMRYGSETPTYDIINQYNSSYKVIIVGDAYMSPYEIMHPGGSVDHNNEEAGSVWLNRITDHFDNCVWINPLEKGHWEMSSSVQIVQDLMDDRMYTLTVGGIKEAIKNLMVKKLKSKKIK